MAKDSMVARGSFSSEDSSTLCAVDLGLGFGLKPGGIPKSDNQDSRSADLDHESFSFLEDLPLPIIEQIESLQDAGVYKGSRKASTWKDSFEQRVEQFKEKAGFSRISTFSLPKRSFSLKVRNKNSSENTTQKEDKDSKGNGSGMRRMNSVRGNFKRTSTDFVGRHFHLLKLIRRRSVNVYVYPQAPQAQCEHGRQKYKDLYGNPDKKLKKIII